MPQSDARDVLLWNLDYARKIRVFLCLIKKANIQLLSSCDIHSSRDCRFIFRCAEIILSGICQHLPWWNRCCLFVHFTMLICYLVFNNVGGAVKKVTENRRPQQRFIITQTLPTARHRKCICFPHHAMYCGKCFIFLCYQKLTRIRETRNAPE